MEGGHVTEIVRHNEHAHDHAQRIKQCGLDGTLARYRITFTRHSNLALKQNVKDNGKKSLYMAKAVFTNAIRANLPYREC